MQTDIQKSFITAAASNFISEGYLAEIYPSIPGLQALLYARSPSTYRLGFARVEDHFIFMDWDNTLFGRLELLKKAHRDFSAFVNNRFHVPRALRMTIPNLAVVAVSNQDFPVDVVQYTLHNYLNPWQGGETGQFMLANLSVGTTVFHTPPGRRQMGGFPLLHACDTIKKIYLLTFKMIGIDQK